MKFNNQICTTREQSERLLSLGLKTETADMYLQSVLNDEWSPFVPIAFPYSDRPEEIVAPDIVNAIPAWSLHRLLLLYNLHYIEFTNDDEIESMYDIVIDAIEQAIEEGHFNKEYLI